MIVCFVCDYSVVCDRVSEYTWAIESGSAFAREPETLTRQRQRHWPTAHQLSATDPQRDNNTFREKPTRTHTYRKETTAGAYIHTHTYTHTFTSNHIQSHPIRECNATSSHSKRHDQERNIERKDHVVWITQGSNSKAPKICLPSRG
jgi:hypothetical protein